MGVGTDSESTSIQVWREAVLNQPNPTRSFPFPEYCRAALEPTYRSGRAKHSSSKLSDRSYRDSDPVQVTITAPPGVPEILGRPQGGMYRELGREVRHYCPQAVFSCIEL